MLEAAPHPHGFQAIAFEERLTRAVFIVFAGTEGSDPDDVLADLGILAHEIDSLKEAIAILLKPKVPSPPNGSDEENAKALSVLRAAQNKQLDNPNATIRDQLVRAWNFFTQVQHLIAVQARFDALHEALPPTGNSPLTPTLLQTRQIVIIGHSLGGYLGQIICAKTGIPTVTFNAPGAAGMAGTTVGPCTNFRRRHDVVGVYGKKIGTEISYPDVPIQWSNFPKPFFIRNHLITQFLQDLKSGLHPMEN